VALRISRRHVAAVVTGQDRVVKELSAADAPLMFHIEPHVASRFIEPDKS
jgi:hypothetical protein